MTVNTSPTNSRVKELPVNKEVITISQELRMLEDVKSTLVDARFKLAFTLKFTKLAKEIDEAIDTAQREIIGAEDRRNERT